MLVTKICPKCGEPSYVEIPETSYEQWQFGISIQKAWPEGSDTDRETLINGLCPKCQGVVFEEPESTDEYTGDDYSEGLGEPDEL